MKNFEFCVTTDILFGVGQEAHLPEKLKPCGRKILLTYGGGSIKKNGLYDRLKALLNDFEIFELGGIAPNPKIESVREGAAICKKEGIDMGSFAGHAQHYQSTARSRSSDHRRHRKRNGFRSRHFQYGDQ